MSAFIKNARRTTGLALALVAGAATAALAQDAGSPSSASSLKLPNQLVVYGPTLPSVVKATAIVNGEVITQTDIDQRLALMAIANGGQLPKDELGQLRQQILRNLIDETLQIQAAKAEEITVADKEIDKTIERVAGNINLSPSQMEEVLVRNGSSLRSIRRQVEGEMAWSRLLRQKIESGISIGDEEVQAVIDRLNASKGTEEYKVGEIFLSSTPANDAQTAEKAGEIFKRLQQGGSFVGYARQFSEASTAAVGGDLGWVRPAQLPAEIASVLQAMRPGTVSQPIKVPGGYSIIAVQDARKILTADPRNALLSLRQVSVNFPQGTSRATADPQIQRFSEAARNIGGCGGAEKLATDFRADLVQSDQVKMRDLPPALQDMMMQMQVGQATPPFGSVEEGVRVLVLCGRDEVDPSLPSYDQVYAQLNEERVNLRARRFLRDLRRDAVIDFR